ncbi:MAG: PAS domain S-box protein [Nitrospirae bacterium]|nr:MAG: PAS domain S-box protein [Nitrospirota bacterium]
MNIEKNSIKFKIIFPIIFFIFLITLVLSGVIYKVSEDIADDYQKFFISTHSREVESIMDRAALSLVEQKPAQDRKAMSVRQKAAITEIANYWYDHDIDGLILNKEGRVIYTTLEDPQQKDVMRFLDSKGTFVLKKDRVEKYGYVDAFNPWNWKLVSISKATVPLLFRNNLYFLFPMVASAFFMMFGISIYLFKHNFQRPMNGMLKDIKNGTLINSTGIIELDNIGAAFNEGFNKLIKKTDQFQILHSLAIALHGDMTTEELLNQVLDKVGRLIKADLAAIAIYDEHGGFKKLVTHGATIKTQDALPEGLGVLKYLYESKGPVHIENVRKHPSFTGHFPPGHPEIYNLLSYPILSDEGRALGAIYFGNKSEGFTEEDQMLLGAVSADVMVALNKADNLTRLKRFKEIIDSAFDVILITDSEGRILYVNHAFSEITGFDQSEAIGKKPNILKSGYHDEQFYKNMWNTIKAGRIWKGEFVNKKKTGDVYYTSAIISPIHTEEGFNFVSIQRDITQEKRLYEQLLRAQKMESIGTLAGGIAHDFNNLLTAILGYSEIMMTKIKEGDPFYKPVNIINNAAEKGAELARKILMVTHKEKLETKPVNINEIVHNCMELLERSMPKNIEISTHLKGDLPNIMADPTQMQQVVINLAVNARDAMPNGGRLSIETGIVGAENGAANEIRALEGRLLRLSISDNGSGIDKETQRKIFDPFFTTKESGKGTGLGLYMVHSIINNHGGYINLYSEPDKGTRFNIYLPVTSGERTEDTLELLELSGTETVLFIDDEPDIRELCRDMIEPLGYKVLLAGSGYEGINIYRLMKDEISLVVLDMVMPKMGGSEVFQALKNIKHDVNVMICSGFSHDGFAGIDNLIKGGASGFIQKPFTRNAIAHAIRQALSKTKADL